MEEWPDNPAEVDSFGRYDYFELQRAKKILEEYEESEDPYHLYELERAKRILKNMGFDPKKDLTPVKYEHKA